MTFEHLPFDYPCDLFSSSITAHEKGIVHSICGLELQKLAICVPIGRQTDTSPCA